LLQSDIQQSVDPNRQTSLPRLAVERTSRRTTRQADGTRTLCVCPVVVAFVWRDCLFEIFLQRCPLNIGRWFKFPFDSSQEMMQLPSGMATLLQLLHHRVTSEYSGLSFVAVSARRCLPPPSPPVYSVVVIPGHHLTECQAAHNPISISTVRIGPRERVHKAFRCIYV